MLLEKSESVTVYINVNIYRLLLTIFTDYKLALTSTEIYRTNMFLRCC